MSSVYNTAPPTAGQVTLHTSHGDIIVALWSKECPKTTRNFIQLCLEKYYDETIFHRVIKDFLIQGGDPTGTGKGGQSIYSNNNNHSDDDTKAKGYFADEFHSRLRFIHRGIVAMANEGVPNSNTSQFFITLSQEAAFLQKKHTIFGKVVGESIYNVLDIGKVETKNSNNDDSNHVGVDNGDRPIDDAPRILSVDVDWNPFDDIVPRNYKGKNGIIAEEENINHNGATQKVKKKKKKNLGLLSFGEEELENEEFNTEQEKTKKKDSRDDEVRTMKAGIKSSHDVLSDKRLSKSIAINSHDSDEGIQKDAYDEDNDVDNEGDAEDFDKKMRESILKKRAMIMMNNENEKSDGRPEKLDMKDNQIDENKADETSGLMVKRDRSKLSEPAFLRTVTSANTNTNLLTADEQNRQRIRNRKRHTKEREKDTLSKLMSFQSSLRKAPVNNVMNGERIGSDSNQTLTDCKSDQKINDRLQKLQDDAVPAAWRVDNYIDDEDDDDFHGDWKKHKLVFKQQTNKSKVDAMARRDDVDDYIVFDPLLQKGKEKFLNSQASRKRERDGMRR